MINILSITLSCVIKVYSVHISHEKDGGTNAFWNWDGAQLGSISQDEHSSLQKINFEAHTIS